MLGRGNEKAAKEALAAYPGGLQIGGGISIENAREYLDAGASHVIVTSWIFHKEILDFSRVRALSQAIGKKNLVLDLSCKRTATGWNIATNRWQTVTSVQVTGPNLRALGEFCDEFLIHAADVEGLQNGMDEALISMLARESPIPVTYAGGARSIDDLKRCALLSENLIDLTIGSALDIFGGKGARYHDCVAFNQQQ
jgi:phosphoribosylformimino-5-aminoimidazole carboxamide ribotide isomerase